MLLIQHDGNKFELGSTIATNAWVSTTILQNMRILIKNYFWFFLFYKFFILILLQLFDLSIVVVFSFSCKQKT
jgi:hypothetical protein